MQRLPDDPLTTQTKLALRRFASSVAVLTCHDGRAPHAMTVTAVNAMSMQPPSMIACVNRAAAFHAAICRATHFAINILHRTHIDISMGCGGKVRGEDRFGFGAWGEESGVPVLTDAQARLVCAREAKFDYGSHSIFIGRVISVGLHGDIDPLVYVDGRYTCLSADRSVATASEVEIEMLRQIGM